jgi:uncharacterized protein (TIGR02594 family)
MFPNEPRWFTWALHELGVRETPGKGSTDRILAYRKLAKIPLDGEDSVVPWCAIFANAALEQSGVKGSRSGAAKSFLDWGVGLKKPVPGAVVVLNRPKGWAWQGHVGFYRGETADQVYLLGGNQGDAVSIAAFDKSRIVGIRWPVGVPVPLDAGPVKITAGKKLAEVSDR